MERAARIIIINQSCLVELAGWEGGGTFAKLVGLNSSVVRRRRRPAAGGQTSTRGRVIIFSRTA